MIGVNFVISATTTALQKGIAGAKLSFEQMRSGIGKATNALTGFLGVGLGAGGILKLSSDALQLAKSLDNTAKKLGLTTDFIQEMGYAADRFGVNQDTVNMALQRFVRRLGEAQQGAGELLPSLKQYNIALKDSNGQARSAEEVLKDYAQAIKGAGTQQEKLRLAFKAFDSEGAALVSILQDGKKGLEEFAKEAKDAGAVMSEETIKGLADAEQAINDWKKRITIAVGEIIINFKTEEGLRLLTLQLLKPVLVFGARIVDAIDEAFQIGYAIMSGTFKGVVNVLQDGLVNAFKFVAEGINAAIPDFLKNRGFVIDIKGLDELKSTGLSVADEINMAIAKTSPSRFRDEVNESFTAAIKMQREVLAEQKQANEEEKKSTLETYDDARRTLEKANQDMKAALEEGGKKAAEHIEKSAEKIAKAAAKLASAFDSFGKSTNQLITKFGDGSGRKFLLGGISGSEIGRSSDEALKELLRRARQGLAEEQAADRIGASSFARAISIASFQRTIGNIEKELAERNNLRDMVEFGGIEYARRFSSVDPLAFDKVVSELVTGRSVAEKTVDELKVTNRLLSGKFKNQ